MPQVYAAAALMEWRNDRSNEAPPKKIFELGAKKFLGVPDFVLSYIDFQLGLGDIANARATFERALTVTPGDQQGPLWDRYVQLEYHVSCLLASRLLWALSHVHLSAGSFQAALSRPVFLLCGWTEQHA